MLIDFALGVLRTDKSPQSQSLYYVLRKATRFRADNVASYLERHFTPDAQFNPWEAFPNLAPLGPLSWFEFEGMYARAEHVTSAGCLVMLAFDRKDAKSMALYADDWYVQQHAEIRWILALQHLSRRQQTLVVGDTFRILCLNEEGQLQDDWVRPVDPDILSRYSEEQQRDILYSARIQWSGAELVALLAINFAHHKEVTIQEKQPGAHARRVAAQHKERAVSFHVLDIRPVALALSKQGHVETERLQRALHTVRASFATYTEAKPLFGKYIGRFYRRAHVRGSTEQEVSLKDYRSHPPTAASREADETSEKRSALVEQRREQNP